MYNLIERQTVRGRFPEIGIFSGTEARSFHDTINGCNTWVLAFRNGDPFCPHSFRTWIGRLISQRL
jgi:hypothetical protein